MTSLLVLLVVVLLGVAVWQLTKIFDLTQIGAKRSDDSEIATDKDNDINGYLMFAFLVLLSYIAPFRPSAPMLQY